MSESHQEHAAGHSDDTHSPSHYVKVWGILVVLLVISVAGPELGIKSVTLFTAFGIAVIKAYMVAKNFMHLNVEKRFVVYLLVTALAFMFLFYAGVSPDVMQHHGHNWKNVAAEDEVKRALSAAAEDHGHDAHGAADSHEHH
jgi:caa(3)-type oxidase subunit IV